MQRAILLSLIGLMLGGCGVTYSQLQETNLNAPPNTGFTVKSVVVDGETHKYGLFIPHAYNKSQHWPVIVFLHGALQAGRDGTNCMSAGLGPAIAKSASTFGFIAVFPQSSGNWEGEDRLKMAMACLDQVEKDYSTDRARVALTGLSNGGYGVWALGARCPQRFSCLAPMAAFTDYDDVPRLTKIPIWCFHGSGDILVSSGGSAEMCKRIAASGGNVRFEKIDGAGHNCWETVFDQGEIFKWMLTHRTAMAKG